MPGRVAILLAQDTVDESYFRSSLLKENRMKKIVENGMKIEDDAEKVSRQTENDTYLLDFLG